MMTPGNLGKVKAAKELGTRQVGTIYKRTRLNIQRDIEAVQQAIRPLLRQHCVIADNDVKSFVHEGSLAGGEHARDSWRGMFAETMLLWHKMETGKS